MGGSLRRQDILRIGNTELPSCAYVGRFNFKGADQQKRVGELSGGERGRLHLAKLLQTGGNVLLLDEPTNDLDIETLRALENALLEFPGCAMVISHDRWFLDRIATTSWTTRTRVRLSSPRATSPSTKSTKNSRGRRRTGAEAYEVQAYCEQTRNAACGVNAIRPTNPGISIRCEL
ncbi:ATP-binding cassette domain-containing protein [Shigella flexneri]